MEDEYKYQEEIKEELNKLDPIQLEALQEESKSDLLLIDDALQLLDMTEKKIIESWSCVNRLKETPVSCEEKVLVPLTEHLFVEGRISDPTGVLVDLGADYVVFMGLAEALQCLDRAMEMIDGKRDELLAAAHQAATLGLAVEQTINRTSEDGQ